MASNLSSASSDFSKHFLKKNLKKDLPASIVVFLVALPLCLGIALASGAPLFAGVLTGIIGGIVVSSLSGSQLSVSGPAAGLTVIVFTSITQLGAYPTFLLAVFIAGLFQIIEGMLAAIGVILILKQIPHAVGYDAEYEGSESFIEGNENTFSLIDTALGAVSYGAVIISLISLIILIYWPKIKKVSGVPAALIVVLTGILLNRLFAGSQLAIKDEHLVQIPVVSSFAEFSSLFVFPDFSQIVNKDVWVVAVTIAIVASIETLLSLEAVDKLDPIKRVSPTNKELLAQGVGNMTSGLLGGLPMTAVIVRSSANVNAGGRTKMSAIIHGLWLLVALLAIPTFINLIPLSCLAAILLVTGYKLAKFDLFAKMWRGGYSQFIPFVVTVLAVVFTDLLKGVAVGMLVSVFYILRNNLRNPYFYQISTQSDKKVIEIKLAEEVSFLNKAAIQYTLAHLPKESNVVIDGSNCRYIDPDVLEVIRNFKHSAYTKAVIVELVNIKDRYDVPKLSELIYKS